MSNDHRDLQIANVSRRALLKGFAAGTGLVLAARWGVARAASETAVYGRDAMPNGWVDDPNVFIQVHTDGRVTITNHRAEMGQGIRTSVAMVIADEMGADWDRVQVQQAIGDEKTYGNQNTDGSRSMRHWFDPLRRCGAAARAMLEQAAAQQWQVPVGEVKAGVHVVVHQPSGREVSFGELAEAAAALTVPDRAAVVLKTPQQWRYITHEADGFKGLKGQQPLAIDGADIVTGKALYGADVYWDGLLYAVIARPPSYGAALRKVDDEAARKVPGVVKVVTLPTASQPSAFEPLGGVAVIASNTWAAIEGRKALSIDWDLSAAGHNATYDSDTYRQQLAVSASEEGKVVRESGHLKRALKSAQQTVAADYYAPHMAQAPMEPPTAQVRIVGDTAEVWTSVQNPQAARDGVAKRLGLAPEKVTVRCGLLGGGFGRKSKPDYIFEAADLSKAMGGKPVRVQWTREDDLQHGYFHTVSMEHLEAGLDRKGQVTGWLHRSVSPTIASVFAPGAVHQSPMEMGMGVMNMPYQVESLSLQTGAAEAHVRIGWFRSVYNIPHAFAIQSFIAELADKAERDHRDFLLALLGPARKIDPRTLGDQWNYSEDPAVYPIDTGRYRDVIIRATEEAGWGKKQPANRGLGLAVHHSFMSYCAVVVDVEVTERGDVIVHRADIAFDCGPQVNPERVRSQLEGACIMGIGIALMTESTAKAGRIQEDNFHRYHIPRIHQAARDIRVHPVNNTFDQPLGGVGEPGVPPIAPAICNAVFAATGRRIRQLPIADQLAG